MRKTAAPATRTSDRRGESVRDRLVQTAARHFAEHGIQGASQRAIQRDVGVNNSTANYYFGSKETLYKAVLEEALGRIQAARIAGLEAISESLPPHERVQALLSAYFGPHLYEAQSDIGYQYAKILASLHLSAPDAATDVVEQHITPVRERYVDALAKLFPDASRNRIYEVLRLAVGLMAMTPIRVGRSSLSNATVERMIRDVVTVSTIAFEELCSGDR